MKRTDFRVICLIALFATLFGCGVDWFPDVRRAGTTPNAFSFNFRKGVPIAGRYSSNSQVITGFANSSTASPISVTDGTVKINGGAETSSSTVKNNDIVKVFQDTATSAGIQKNSVVTIGIISATFSTLTQTIATPTSSSFQVVNSGIPNVNELRSGQISGTDSGGHNISISGTNAQFAVMDNNLANFLVGFTSNAVFTSFLVNNRILLRIPTSTASVTLTIDDTNYVITNANPPVITASPK